MKAGGIGSESCEPCMGNKGKGKAGRVAHEAWQSLAHIRGKDGSRKKEEIAGRASGLLECRGKWATVIEKRPAWREGRLGRGRRGAVWIRPQ